MVLFPQVPKSVSFKMDKGDFLAIVEEAQAQEKVPYYIYWVVWILSIGESFLRGNP